MSEILLLLSAAGITFGIQHKLPFLHNKHNLLDAMLKCTYCTGFHAGWISYIVAQAPQLNPQGTLLFAFASAIFSYALDESIKFLEESDYGDNGE